MNETLIKYLAGLLDADGSLSFWFDKRANTELFLVRLQLRLASSQAVDKTAWIDTLPDQTGLGVVVYDREYKTWVVSARADLETLLPRLIKHLVIKGRHWNWLLQTWRHFRTHGPVTLLERQALSAASKQSRQDVGPLRPKNHPTWAWLAGYLDGDGTYHYRQHKGRWHIRVSAAAHKNDQPVLDFLCRAFGGRIIDQNPSGSVRLWYRSLGYQNRDFALRFLPNLAKHSRLKRDKIDAIIHHHRQRLSVQGVRKDVSDSLKLHQ